MRFKRCLMTLFNYLTEASLLVRLGVQGAGVFCPAHFLKKVKRLYRLSVLPSLLPNLIDVPPSLP
ncbi:MAG: hypothetical protein U0231_09330 [Nitrospiraceae bacterium]